MKGNMKVENRNKVFVVMGAHNTCLVYNYSGKSEVNSFLHHFEIWDGRGHQILCSYGNHSKFEFECSKEFYEFCKTDDFKRAFRSMGVEVTFDYDEVRYID